MRALKNSTIIFLSAALILQGWSSMNKTQKGAVVGTATGTAMGGS